MSVQLRNNQVKDDALYCVAYQPGLNEHRWGIFWHDGIADKVPGYLVQRAVGAVSPLAVFPMGTKLEWYRRRPLIVEEPAPPAPPPPSEPVKRKRGRPRKVDK